MATAARVAHSNGLSIAAAREVVASNILNSVARVNRTGGDVFSMRSPRRVRTFGRFPLRSNTCTVRVAPICLETKAPSTTSTCDPMIVTRGGVTEIPSNAGTALVTSASESTDTEYFVRSLMRFQRSANSGLSALSLRSFAVRSPARLGGGGRIPLPYSSSSSAGVPHHSGCRATCHTVSQSPRDTLKRFDSATIRRRLDNFRWPRPSVCSRAHRVCDRQPDRRRAARHVPPLVSSGFRSPSD